MRCALLSELLFEPRSDPETSRMTHPLFAPRPPLVAILRGLTPAEAVPVGQALFDAGFRLLEVPLNRPHALDCIRALRAIAPPDALLGGGTVLATSDVDAVHAAGGSLMVAPNCNPAVIAHARNLDMLCLPGVATPTEAFAALDAGAQAVKAFPAETITPAGIKAWLSVLPPGTAVLPVGGITPDSLAAWHAAGAAGYGIGSALFTPGTSVQTVAERAARYLAAWRKLG
jgi:2-dehydro-3-deoxyphosphogalactonate aldolase